MTTTVEQQFETAEDLADLAVERAPVPAAYVARDAAAAGEAGVALVHAVGVLVHAGELLDEDLWVRADGAVRALVDAVDRDGVLADLAKLR